MSRKLATWVKEGNTAIITMDNPPVNVITSRLRAEIRECLCEARDDADVITIIITGAGEKAFMAGADINGFTEMIKKPGAAYDFLYEAYDVWYLLENLEKPTIAAINGLALGAGCEMALCCDLRIAGEKAKIGLPEIKLGLFPGGGGTQRLARLIGKAKTKELIFTGEPISARTALEMGIINHVTPAGEELSKAKELAAKINQYSLTALKCAKAAIDEGLDTTLRSGIEIEARYFQQVFMGEDISEGVAAFLEKRTAKFQQHK